MPRKPGPRKRNEAGGHRSRPDCPPIHPELTYPLCRLADWGFGNRSVAALQAAGLETFQFGRTKFFTGKSLIATLKRGRNAEDAEALDDD